MSTQGTSQQSVVKIVEEHIEHLISDHKRLSERNRELSAQCDALRVRSRELQSRVTELERLLAMSELAATLSSAGDGVSSASRQRARSYVNRLMREIDACLTYMTSSPTDSGVAAEKQE